MSAVLATIWATIVAEYEVDSAKFVVVAVAIGLFGLMCLSCGGCAGCVVEKHRPHWFGSQDQQESPEPPMAPAKVFPLDRRFSGPCEVQSGRI